MNGKSGIYRIRNLVNNKSYIGSAINLKNRWAVHQYTFNKGKHPNRYLNFAFIKYGLINFIFEVLEYCKKEDLINKEQSWIDFCNPEYNIRKIAKSNLGIKFTNEAKAKLKGRIITPENRLKLTLSVKGKKQSSEWLAKRSEALRKKDKWPHGSHCYCDKCKVLRNERMRQTPSYQRKLASYKNGLCKT